MQDFEQAYNQQGSQWFSSDDAAVRRGSYGRFMDQGGSVLGRFGGVMNSGFRPGKGTNAQEEEALSGMTEQANMNQFSSNMGRIQNQFGQQAQLGFSAVSNIQAAQQAKEMAALQAQSANQGATFSAISSGLGALGSIGKASNWFRPQTSSSLANRLDLPSAWQLL